MMCKPLRTNAIDVAGRKGAGWKVGQLVLMF